jgi:hypothetical protein
MQTLISALGQHRPPLGLLKTFGVTNTVISKSKEASMKRFVGVFCFTAAKFGAYGTICSIAFVTSITDALEPCAALPSLTKFSTIFHLPASSNAFRLSFSTSITIVDFLDGHATSPGFH